jgi:hypothetical protein
MRLCSLNHLLGELLLREKSDRIVVLGSASLLAHFPEIGEQGLPKLRERLHSMPLGEKEMFRAGRNLHALTAS